MTRFLFSWHWCLVPGMIWVFILLNKLFCMVSGKLFPSWCRKLSQRIFLCTYIHQKRGYFFLKKNKRSAQVHSSMEDFLLGIFSPTPSGMRYTLTFPTTKEHKSPGPPERRRPLLFVFYADVSLSMRPRLCFAFVTPIFLYKGEWSG